MRAAHSAHLALRFGSREHTCRPAGSLMSLSVDDVQVPGRANGHSNKNISSPIPLPSRSCPNCLFWRLSFGRWAAFIELTMRTNLARISWLPQWGSGQLASRAGTQSARHKLDAILGPARSTDFQSGDSSTLADDQACARHWLAGLDTSLPSKVNTRTAERFWGRAGRACRHDPAGLHALLHNQLKLT